MREDEKCKDEDVKLTFGRIVVVSCFIEVLSVISIGKYNVFLRKRMFLCNLGAWRRFAVTYNLFRHCYKSCMLDNIHFYFVTKG